jgi:hypothetical protein
MYLVWMYGPRNGESQVLRRERHRDEMPSYERMQSGLEELFPGRRIYTPLEQARGKFFIVACYLSKDRNGVGRSRTQTHEWAVEGEPPTN